MLLVRVGLNCHLLTLKKTVSSMDVEDDDLEQLRRAALRTMKRYPSQSRGRGALFKPHPLYSNLISIIPCVEEEPLEKPPQQPEVVSKFNRFNDSKAESSGGDETEGEQDKKCGSTGEADTSFEDLIYQLQQALDDDGSEQKAGSNGEKPLPDTTCNSGSKSASPVVDGSSKHSAVKRELSPVEDKAPVAVDSSLSPEAPKTRGSNSVNVAHSPASKKHKGRVVSLRGASPTAEADREEKAVSSKKLRKLPVKTPNRSLEKLVKKQETATTNGRVKAVSLKRDSESSPDDQETEVRLPLNAEAPRRPLSQSRRESELRSIVCEVAESSADEEVMVGKARMDLRAKLVQNRTRKPMAERWYRPTRILQSALEGIYVGVKGSEDGERLSMKKARPSQESSQRRVFFLDSNSARQNAPSFNVTIPKGAKYKPSSSSSPVVNHERRRDRMFSYVNLKKGKEDSFVARSIGQGPVLFFEYLTSSFLSARPICTNWDIRWILFCVAMVKCRLQPIS
ncbi:uncharacterized protein [Anabrus simplex]|uniref:uncharacterized protein isoform X8 n=1 Tax=Anabrus simplex TaxID=316456 RepID=UPI0035A2784F